MCSGFKARDAVTCQYRVPVVNGRTVIGATGCTEGMLFKGNVLVGALPLEGVPWTGRPVRVTCVRGINRVQVAPVG